MGSLRDLSVGKKTSISRGKSRRRAPVVKRGDLEIVSQAVKYWRHLVRTQVGGGVICFSFFCLVYLLQLTFAPFDNIYPIRQFLSIVVYLSLL